MCPHRSHWCPSQVVSGMKQNLKCSKYLHLVCSLSYLTRCRVAQPLAHPPSSLGRVKVTEPTEDMAQTSAIFVLFSQNKTKQNINLGNCSLVIFLREEEIASENLFHGIYNSKPQIQYDVINSHKT